MTLRRPLLPLLLVPVACAWLAACEPSAPPAEAPTGSPADASPTAPEASGNGLGLPLATLLARAQDRTDAGALPVLSQLAAPKRTATETVPNRHVPGQLDTVKTLHYDGLRLEVYVTGGGKETLQGLTVASPAYETAEGLAVGLPPARVRETRGAPDRHEGTSFVYELGPGGGTFAVSFDGGRATTLAWRFYVD